MKRDIKGVGCLFSIAFAIKSQLGGLKRDLTPFVCLTLFVCPSQPKDETRTGHGDSWHRPLQSAFAAAFLLIATFVFGSAIAQQPSVSSTLEFLELLGFSESELAYLCDDESMDPLDAESSPDLQKLMGHLNRLPRWRAAQWRRKDVDLAGIGKRTGDFQGELVQISGRLRSIATVKVPMDLAERVGFPMYFVCSIENPADKKLFVVATVNLPKSLENTYFYLSPDATIDEKVRTTALYLNTNADGQMLFAARELEWFPDKKSLLVKSEDHLKLAKLGFDVGRLAEVIDRKPLEANDRECFYQLLAAMGRRVELADQGTGAANSIPAVGAIELLQNPEKHRGRLYSVTGTARRAIRVAVDDPDIVERLGITHYYEIEVFDSLAKVTVAKVGDEQDAVFNSYPVVFCTRTIPEWMPTGDVIHQDVMITGAYMKLWSYRSQFLSESDPPPGAKGKPQKRQLQLSPLLIGHSPSRAPETATSNPTAGLAVGIGFGIALAALSFYVWKTNQGDRRYRDRLRRFEKDEEDGRHEGDLQ